jgi:hypothetical protein
MTLRAVPRPEGFDLREARASKASSATKWLPEDALFDASKDICTDSPVGAMMIAWYVRDPSSGFLRLKYRCWQEHERQNVALAADMLHDLQTPP